MSVRLKELPDRPPGLLLAMGSGSMDWQGKTWSLTTLKGEDERITLKLSRFDHAAEKGDRYQAIFLEPLDS